MQCSYFLYSSFLRSHYSSIYLYFACPVCSACLMWHLFSVYTVFFCVFCMSLLFCILYLLYMLCFFYMLLLNTSLLFIKYHTHSYEKWVMQYFLPPYIASIYTSIFPLTSILPFPTKCRFTPSSKSLRLPYFTFQYHSTL